MRRVDGAGAQHDHSPNQTAPSMPIMQVVIIAKHENLRQYTCFFCN